MGPAPVDWEASPAKPGCRQRSRRICNASGAMGILDDAIREHLELKRQHGAGSEDLERLENEAFGAPARPGDPEFADGEGDAAQAVAAEPETTVAEPEPEGGSTSDWLADAGEPEAEATPQPESDAERARAEHPLLDDTADHPAPDPEPEPEASEPSFEEPGPPPAEPADEAAPPEAPESSIFDADEVDLGEFDLELDREEEAPAAGEPSAPSEPLPPDEPNEVRRDAVFEDDTSEAPAPVQPRPEGGEGDEPEGEDLLGETPDFLQDAPEGEDLWFEQGPPKDFDFDEDD